MDTTDTPKNDEKESSEPAKYYSREGIILSSIMFRESITSSKASSMSELSCNVSNLIGNKTKKLFSVKEYCYDESGEELLDRLKDAIYKVFFFLPHKEREKTINDILEVSESYIQRYKTASRVLDHKQSRENIRDFIYHKYNIYKDWRLVIVKIQIHEGISHSYPNMTEERYSSIEHVVNKIAKRMVENNTVDIDLLLGMELKNILKEP